MIEQARSVQYRGADYSVATKFSRQSDDLLVFLHGIGCAKECFEAAFDTELARRFSVLTMDFVGFGSSDKPEDFSYTMEDHAGVAEQVIDQFKPQSVSLVAHSMGGAIGVLLARRLRNLATLINAEGNLVSKDVGIVSRRTAEWTEEGFVTGGYDQFLGGLRASDEPAYRAWAEWYARSGRVAVYRSGSSLVAWSDSGKLLRHFNELPSKAFVYGDKTDNTHMLGQLQGAEIIPIPHSGHFMMLDNPQAFYSAVGRCLIN